MKSWEKAEGDGEERQKSDIGGCLFGSVSMMDVWRAEEKIPLVSVGKRGNEETPAVSQERQGRLEVLMRQYSKYGVFFVHISCI